MKKTRSNTTMIEQTHNQVPQEPTTDSTVAHSLRTLTLCLDQLLNREPEEAITYDGDEPEAHFFSQLDFTLQEFYELKCTSMAEIETYYKNKVRIGLAINLPKSAIVQALSNGVSPLKLPNNDHRARAEHLPPPWTRTHHILAVTVADNTGTHSVSSEGPTRGLFGPLHLRSTTSSNPKDRLGLQVSTRPQQRRAREKPSNANFGSRTPPKLNEPTFTLNQHMPGIAGVLKQVHPDGNIYPVQYYSRALRSYERNYTISELECLAIEECVDKFRVYLLGTRFVIYSDHHALQWLKTIKDPTGRLFRWSLQLSAYDYEVKYLKGSRQYEADLLSRNPFCGFLSTGQIKDHQGELRRDTRYILNDKDLMTITRCGVTKIIFPPSLRGTLLQRAHRDFNHPGISQMTRLIAAQYYWDGMTNDIRTHVRTCPVCQLVKPPKGPIYGELGQLPPAVLLYELVSLDTISGFAKYGNSQTFLHVVVDHATRYAWAFPSRSTSILTYTQVIEKVMQFGSPKRLLTERAPAFTSPKFRRFLIRHNIGQLLTTSNNPQANRLSERLNATITGKLKLLRLQQPKTAWTKLLPQTIEEQSRSSILKKNDAKVLKIARENGLKFDKTKTQLMKPSVRYLGHIVSTEGIRPLESKYPEVFELRSTKAEMVIEKLKEVFARFGVPEIMMTDNGPPFQSTEMMEFAKEWNRTPKDQFLEEIDEIYVQLILYQDLRKKKVLQKSKNNLTLNHLHLPRARRLQPQLEPDAED
ncbi:hypothetical protein LAZ67_2006816 [Cordylochernes scorpioides]|uniref:RNA-directed DNA polymerase n=1 Tax=Cordylochernes scorpioides TaxID=51811 RepID=A0ABY6K5T3_9ARAC|nr:hypothetical protein LAZ67_2006816 [Cordylochernes scorpioides]